MLRRLGTKLAARASRSVLPIKMKSSGELRVVDAEQQPCTFETLYRYDPRDEAEGPVQPGPTLTITSIDRAAGTITVGGSDGKA